MADEGFKRKLTAILSADVVGYSRLMGQDEDITVQTLTKYRDVITSLITDHKGRVVDSPGDNILAEFVSVVNSLRCAWDVQQEIKSRNAELPHNHRMTFRIGINLGDVIEEGDRIYGDGVNIAARLEGLAEEGGICISGAVYDQIKIKLPFGYEYQGEQAVKNIREPIRVYKVLIEKDVDEPILDKKLELPDKPSIAILPFVNMSGDPEQEYFSDGITEDITTALSRSSMLFVISRNSSFTYKGAAVDARRVSRDLGVRYILEGSVRKAGNHIRVTAQLIDGTTGNHIWAEKYDGELQDIFELQDKITQQVAATIQPQIYLFEGQKGISLDRPDVATWELLARAWKLFHEFTREGYASAEKLLRKIVTSEVKSSEANALLAGVIAMKIFFRYSSDAITDAKEALVFAKRAVSLNSNNEYAHIFLGLVQYALDKRELAIGEFRRAIEINPNCSLAYGPLGTVLSTKDPDESIKNNMITLRINPRDPINFIRFSSLAWAYFMKGKSSEGVHWARKAIQMNPHWRNAHFYLTTNLVKLDKLDEAEEAVKYYLEYYPDETISKIKAFWSYDNKEGLDQVYEALRKAGLPE
jgi:adenylate cyclase